LTDPPRILFDECVGAGVANVLATLLATSPVKPEVKHVREFQREGVPDSEWIPSVAGEGWIIISADRGKRNKLEADDEKLPYLCRKLGITHVLLSAKIHMMRGFDKAVIIAGLWAAIAEQCTCCPRGTRFVIRKSGDSARLVNFDVEQDVLREKRRARESSGTPPNLFEDQQQPDGPIDDDIDDAAT
jgi:hypothetical protein